MRDREEIYKLTQTLEKLNRTIHEQEKELVALGKRLDTVLTACNEAKRKLAEADKRIDYFQRLNDHLISALNEANWELEKYEKAAPYLKKLFGGEKE